MSYIPRFWPGVSYQADHNLPCKFLSLCIYCRWPPANTATQLTKKNLNAEALPCLRKIQTLLHLNRWRNDQWIHHVTINHICLLILVVESINNKQYEQQLHAQQLQPCRDSCGMGVLTWVQWIGGLRTCSPSCIAQVKVSTHLHPQFNHKQTPNSKQQSTSWWLRHGWRVWPMYWWNTPKYCATIRLLDIWSLKSHSRVKRYIIPLLLHNANSLKKISTTLVVPQ